MTSDGQMHFELLSIEINEPKLKNVFTTQLKKGIFLSQILPAIEKDSIAQIRKTVALLQKNKNIDSLETKFIKARRAINETLKWLEYLVDSRKKALANDPLPKNEKEAVQKIESELQDLIEKMAPAMKTILRKREEENTRFAPIFKETIEQMEKQTRATTKKVVLEYEKLGKEKYALIQATYDQFFKNLRRHSEKIIQFVQPKLPEWNALVLKMGKGFYIQNPKDLPCSILFSVKGQCYLIFENKGHLLGMGVDKLVLRSISLPQGKIQALIKPLFIKGRTEDQSPNIQKFEQEKQFWDMWLETEILIKLKGKRGIINLDERMIFLINEEKTLFLVEDYYWDGTMWDYLKFPIYNKIESSQLSPQLQKRILIDLLCGLIEVHKNGIIHHDIKPDNILLDFKKRGSKAVLADFHQATYLNDKDRIGSLKFIPVWSAPEYAKIHLDPNRPHQVLHQEYLVVTNAKLDVWSLGLIFYCLIAYELPLWVGEWLQRKGKETPEDIRATYQLLAGLKKGWLPSHLKTSPYYSLLEKMLEPDPKDRCTALEAMQILKNCS
jgi:hypothetical protein